MLFVAAINSPSHTKPKICADCKFIRRSFFGNKYAQCSQLPYTETNSDYLVVGGDQYYSNRYYFCSTARDYDDLCGKSGKLYQPKKNKKE